MRCTVNTRDREIAPVASRPVGSAIAGRTHSLLRLLKGKATPKHGEVGVPTIQVVGATARGRLGALSFLC